MKTTILFALILSCAAASAQTVLNPDTARFDTEKPIAALRLAGDTLTTSFLIRIDGRVPTHYHARHSEHVYVLEGSGTMWMNGDTIEITAGDYVFIPSETRHGAASTEGTPLKVLSIQAPGFKGKDRILAE